MKLFIFILILACFLQGAFLPLNLALILLISRSLITVERSNLILGFIAGILLGLITSVNIGFYSLLFLIFIELTHTIKKSPLSSNILTIVPLTFLFTGVLSFFEQTFFGSQIHISLLFVQALLSLPLFLVIRFWEERFIISTPLKLKV